VHQEWYVFHLHNHTPYPNSRKPLGFLMIKILDGDSHSPCFTDKGQEFTILSTHIIHDNPNLGEWSPYTCNKMTNPWGTSCGLNFVFLSDVVFFLVYTFLFFLRFKILLLVCALKFYCLLCIIFIINMHSFVRMTHVFVYWMWINTSCVTCFNFLKHTQVSRLSEGLMVCPMIIDQSLNHYNPIKNKLK
jgi:hypothetical protein